MSTAAAVTSAAAATAPDEAHASSHEDSSTARSAKLLCFPPGLMALRLGVLLGPLGVHPPVSPLTSMCLLEAAAALAVGEEGRGGGREERGREGESAKWEGRSAKSKGRRGRRGETRHFHLVVKVNALLLTPRHGTYVSRVMTGLWAVVVGALYCGSMWAKSVTHLMFACRLCLSAFMHGPGAILYESVLLSISHDTLV